jgi:hypothetical protein
MNSMDDQPTDLGNGLGEGYSSDEDPTRIASSGYSGEDGGEGETVFGPGQGRGQETEPGDPRAVNDAILWVKEGRRRGHYYAIRHGTVIGRDEGNLILDDPKASGTHAKIIYENKHYVIWDFGSSNGTYVNGKRIRQATPLEENDVIRIGNTVFVLKLLNQTKKLVKSVKTRKTKKPVAKSQIKTKPKKSPSK